MTTAQKPTLKSWLRDGATLVGLDEQAQAKLKTQGNAILEGAARDLSTIEKGVQGLERKIIQGLAKLRTERPDKP